MTMPKINFNDSEISRFQDNVDTALTPLQSMPMVGGTVLVNVALVSAQDNLVRHGLGRRPQYFIIVKSQVNSTFWSPNSISLNNANADATYINLRCSANATVSVWVN
jgi:hypothetical protein